MLAVTAHAQIADTLRVKGIVVDGATGEKLFGARVTSTTSTTITDEEGAFSVVVPSERTELRVEFAGYQERRIAVRSRQHVAVRLYAESYTAGRYNSETFTNQPAVTIDELLSEHFGGDMRSTSHSGQAGMGSAMFIRGYHSVNGSSQPLIVVDGTPWNTLMQEPSVIGGYLYNPLQTIDPNDVERIEVLKDASSLYGAKGANGAIIITTKRSHTMATKIGVDLSYGFNWRPQQPDVMNATEQRIFMTEIMKGANLTTEEQTSFEKTLLVDAPTSIYYNKYHNQTDWNDAIFHTGNTQRYGISVEGGDNIALYMLSLSYTKSDQSLRGTDFNRLNTRINSDVKLSKQFTIGSDISFGYVTRNLMDDGVNKQSSPTFIAATKSPLFSAYKWKNDGSAMTGTLSDVDELGIANPVAIIKNGVAENKQYRLAVSVHPEYQLDRHFKLSDRFTYMLDNTKEHYFNPRTGTPVYKIADIDIQDEINDQTISQNELMNEARLDYRQEFGKDHQLATAFGWRLMSATYKNSLGRGYNTASDDLSNLTGALAAQQLEGLHDTWRNNALMLSADYRYQQLYRLWTVLSLEASSRFGNDAGNSMKILGGRYGFFPSFGAEWNLANESFLKDVTAFDRLLLHASVGISGNDDMGRQGKNSYLQPVKYLGAAYGLVLGTPVNSGLKWEQTTKADIGIDAELLHGRLNVGIDYYRHRTSDLIMYRQDRMTQGSIGYPVNSGTMTNEGFEVTVDGKILAKRHFGWNATLSMNHNKNQMTSLPEASVLPSGAKGLLSSVAGGQVLTAVGHPIAVFYGYRTEGVFGTDAEAASATPNGYLKKVNTDTSISCFKAGDIHFTDINNDGFIDEGDMTIIGDPSPDFTGAWANHFTMGRLSLDINFSYSVGGQLYNYRRQMLESMTDFSNQSRAVTRRWRLEGQQTDMPRATFGDPMDNSRFSDRWIESGSYLKLSEVRVSYQWPMKRYIEGVTLWAATTNLYTWTRYLGSDPETSMTNGTLYQGIDTGLLPHGRTLYIGAKINL